VEHVVLECDGFDASKKLNLAEFCYAAKEKRWLAEEYSREQAREQAREQDNQTQKQAMPHTDVGPWQQPNQDTSDTNKRRCVQSTLETYGHFDRCDEVWAKTITAAITVFLVGCTIPFRIVESSFFIKMIEYLNLGGNFVITSPKIMHFVAHI
jgi:hypothetical protein